MVTCQVRVLVVNIELVSKELNHLVAILQHFAGSLIFMNKKNKNIIIFQK